MPDRGVDAIHEPASMLAGISGWEDELLMTLNYDLTATKPLKTWISANQC